MSRSASSNERIIMAAAATLEADIRRGGAARARSVEEDRKKTGAGFNRGNSKQDYATPRDFLKKVQDQFDVVAWSWDLAAVSYNTVTRAADGRYFGPDNTTIARRDALQNDWTGRGPHLWLNPPFDNIAPWAAKCAASVPFRARAVSLDGRAKSTLMPRIFFLIPASVGANWWASSVHDKAAVHFLNGRLSFDGLHPYPKDCALVIYGAKPGYHIWRWK